jgi:electron transfer flavoprotein alpha subunit
VKALVLDTGAATAHAIAAAEALTSSISLLSLPASPEAAAAVVASIANPYDIVCAAADALGRAALPRAGALCSVPMLSDVIEVRPDKLVRATHAGRAIATIAADLPLFFTVRASAFPAAARIYPYVAAGSPQPGPAARIVRAAVARAEGRDLAHARTVVGLGRGAAGAALQPRIGELADLLHAAIAGSRPAIDAGAVAETALLGQSGRSVAPDLYLALGISGAWQHFAGVRDAKVIAAINSDPQAPIFGWADYAWVADLETALPELLAALRQP